jgi:hypothetical protein
MRFHTTHLLALVVVAAVALAVARDPTVLIGAAIALVAGACVVLPVLGTAEFFTSEDAITPDIGWGAACLIGLVAIAGSVAAVIALTVLLQIAS